MKRLTILATTIWLSLTCLAQTQSWKAFDDFHASISKIIHPVITGNIEPVKQNSGLLLTNAKAWQASAVPKTVDSAVFKTQVAELVKQCQALDDAVKAKQSDSEVIKQANTVHETFHALLRACNLKD